MVDFEAKYTALSAELAGKQKKLDVKSALGIYYGLSKDGNMRLAFMSVSPAPKIESTKTLRVTQGEESKTVYWTCFDLLQPDAKKVFFTFCENLIENRSAIVYISRIFFIPVSEYSFKKLCGPVWIFGVKTFDIVCGVIIHAAVDGYKLVFFSNSVVRDVFRYKANAIVVYMLCVRFGYQVCICVIAK